MAKTEKPESNEIPKGHVRLRKLDAEGGEITMPKAKADKLLKLEKKIDMKNFELIDTDGNSGPEENKGTMGGSNE